MVIIYQHSPSASFEALSFSSKFKKKYFHLKLSKYLTNASSKHSYSVYTYRHRLTRGFNTKTKNWSRLPCQVLVLTQPGSYNVTKTPRPLFTFKACSHVGKGKSLNVPLSHASLSLKRNFIQTEEAYSTSENTKLLLHCPYWEPFTQHFSLLYTVQEVKNTALRTKLQVLHVQVWNY